ncbi:glycoside hydrolase family 43 protein [Cellulomonas fimi]|uniref:glycoside hydrolase family 43 protein n=1 Tax=Cellulomonas fimi TaxID=1708 RepID=UPI0002E67455|nr:glycoside hydrolase family 43 protein [Cellulomonas fimi]VEH36893.1 Beta-xylosidase [Cellulomonas fimi]
MVDGYLFAYFAGESTPDGEQVRFAVSRGADPLRYDVLHDGRPVLVSTVGERGVRDPFLVRAPAGGRYWVIATDLRIHGSGDWAAAVRTGSRSLVVWESPDLLTWSTPRLVEVSPPTAGCTWAPEAVWDDEHDEFLVFWASTLYAADDPEHLGETHHRMLCATTRDFVTVQPARVWSDPGHSVIDSTLLRHDGWWYRFTKDERDPSSASRTAKFLTAERSRDLRSTAYEPVTDGIGRTTDLGPGVAHGEGPVVVPSPTGDRWYLLVDEFGGRGYVPFTSATLDAPVWAPVAEHHLPPGARHGSVLPLTAAEHDALRRTLGPPSA